MKKFVMAGAAMLIFSFAAYATDYGKYETFLGYTYTRFETGNFIPAPFTAPALAISTTASSFLRLSAAADSI